MTGKVVPNDPEWVQTVNPLIAALRRGHYFLYSQSIHPVIPTPGERPFQEILIRYLEEERRMLPPGMFLPVLEEQGLMPLLDCWVVSQVLKLQEAGIAGKPGWVAPRNSINLSEDSLLDPEFSDFVINQLKARKPAPDTLSFEVAESIAIDHPQALQELIDTLQPVDCTFSLSRFSGSEASMNLIRTLPVSFIKIDGSLTRQVARGADGGRMKSINDACHAVGIRTIAEQVEDDVALGAVMRAGVDFAQGFGVSQPGPMLAD